MAGLRGGRICVVGCGAWACCARSASTGTAASTTSTRASSRPPSATACWCPPTTAPRWPSASGQPQWVDEDTGGFPKLAGLADDDDLRRDELLRKRKAEAKVAAKKLIRDARACR